MSTEEECHCDIDTSAGLKAVKNSNETSPPDDIATSASVAGRGGGDQVADADSTTSATETNATTTTTTTTDPKGREGEEPDVDEEGFFVNEAQFIKAAQILMQYGRLVIVGPPRSGKTYFAHALLQFFKKKGYIPKFKMNFCGLCLRSMPKEDGGWPKRIVLVDNGFDRLRMTEEMLRGISSFIYNTQTVWHKREWNSLFIVVTYPHLLTDVERMEHSPDTTLLNHPQIIIKMTQDPRNPNLPFVPTVDSLMPFLNRVLRDLENTKLFSLLLAMNLQEIFTYTYRVQVTRDEMSRLGYGESMGCHDLDRLSIILKDVLFHRTKGGFINRDVYDACGLVLGLNGMMITLLRVCDAKFLVDHVRLDEDVQPSRTILVVPKNKADLRMFTFARMYEVLVKKGAGKELSQHPSFCYPGIVQEFFQYCRGQKSFAQKLMNSVDADSGLPLLYWSLWAPSSHLSGSCLEVLVQTVSKDSDLSGTVISSLVACVLLSPPGSSVFLSVKEFIKKLYRFHFKHDNNTMNITLPFPECSSAMDIQTKVEQVKASVKSRLCYLNDPALPIPPRLLTLSTSEETLTLTISTDHWYLILRLLTDTDKDEKDQLENTVLHIAAGMGDAQVLSLIVKSGASLTVRNKKGLTPTQVDEKKKKNRDVQRGRPSEDPNSQKLLTAAEKGDVEAVKVLLCLGASLQTQDSAKNTPLHLASREGHTEIASVMLQLKANVDAQNVDKQTPLYVSCASGHLLVAKLLLDHGADVRTQDSQRSSPLHEACRQGLPDLATLLVNHGADVNSKDKKGMTPLYLTCQGGHTDTAELLLQQGRAQLNVKNGAEGMAALHAACQVSHPDMVSLLLHHQADLQLKDACGRTPADIVREMGLQGPEFEQLLNHST